MSVVTNCLVVDELLDTEGPPGGDSLHEPHGAVRRLAEQDEADDDMPHNSVSDLVLCLWLYHAWFIALHCIAKCWTAF